MEEPVEHRRNCGRIAEQLAPVFDGPVRCQQRAGAFVTAHDDFEEFFGGGWREFTHAEVVDDQQRDGGEQFHAFLSRAIQSSFCNFGEQCVCLTIEHTIALLDGGQSDGLSQMTLSGAGWSEKQSVFVTGDEIGSSQVEDEAAVHLLVEIEIEVVQRVQVSEARGFSSTLKESV